MKTKTLAETIAILLIIIVAVVTNYLVYLYGQVWGHLAIAAFFFIMYFQADKIVAFIASLIFRYKMNKNDFIPGKYILAVGNGKKGRIAIYKLKKPAKKLKYHFLKYEHLPELCLIIDIQYSDNEEDKLYLFGDERIEQMWIGSGIINYYFNFYIGDEIRTHFVLETSSKTEFPIAGKSIQREHC